MARKRTGLEVERAFRRARSDAIWSGLGLKGAATIAVVGLVLVFLAYRVATPNQSKAEAHVHGIVVGRNCVDAKWGAGCPSIAVQLDGSNRQVTVSLDVSVDYRPGANVELEPRVSTRWPDDTTYRFVRYLDSLDPPPT